MALGHSLLVVAYDLLSRPYRDLSVQYFDEGQRELLQHGLVKRLQYRVC